MEYKFVAATTIKEFPKQMYVVGHIEYWMEEKEEHRYYWNVVND